MLHTTGTLEEDKRTKWKTTDNETTAGPIETEENEEQKQEQANKQIWKRVDEKTIILKQHIGG